ncbi:MAG: hypothetical protein GY913_20130 [Proteobacteria bacterium]|nr:hypothetical protein [Pseudomonadota bacterium]
MILALLSIVHADPMRFIGVSLVAPAGEEAALVAASGPGEPVMFVDDGSVAMDHAGDGEYWALVKAEGSSTPIRIQGVIGNTPLEVEVDIATPAAWDSPVHVVTYRAEAVAGAWELTRVLTAPMRPPPEDATGAGAGALAVEGGWSAAGLFLIWGVFLVALLVTAVLRASLLEAGQGKR